MAIIVDNISGNKAIQLGAEEFVRPMTIGNNWMKLRVAVRAVINSSTALSDVRFMIGLCSGYTNTFTSSNCTGYIGSQWPHNYLTFNPTYHANGYYYYSTGAAVCFQAVKKIGNTETAISASPGLQHNFVANTNSRICMQSTDFYRSTLDSTSYNVKPNQCTSGQVNANPDRYAFLRTIEDEPYSSAFAAAYQSLQGSATGYGVTGLPAVMDTVSIYWNHSTPTVDICDVTVIRFY